MDEPSETVLINQLLQKDRAAYQQAVRQFQSPMRALAFRIVGESIADEVVQDAWIAIMRGLPAFQRRSSLKTWVLTIVANEAKMRLRKEKPTISLQSRGHAIKGSCNQGVRLLDGCNQGVRLLDREGFVRRLRDCKNQAT